MVTFIFFFFLLLIYYKLFITSNNFIINEIAFYTVDNLNAQLFTKSLSESSTLG